MVQATDSPITIHHIPETGAEPPQSPRFAVQRLTKAGNWETLTFGTYGDIEPEDSPYHGRPLIYHSHYMADLISRAYHDETVRVHELGTAEVEAPPHFLEAAE